MIEAGPCVLSGVLFDLGEYPGLLPGDGQVVGELYELADPTLIHELDEYEGYNALMPSQSEYIRRVTRLIDPAVDAWVYYFNGDTRGSARVISGDWAQHLRRRKIGRS